MKSKNELTMYLKQQPENLISALQQIDRYADIKTKSEEATNLRLILYIICIQNQDLLLILSPTLPNLKSHRDCGSCIEKNERGVRFCPSPFIFKGYGSLVNCFDTFEKISNFCSYLPFPPFPCYL